MYVEWSCKSFSDLTVQELYAILQLRNKVFVVEQHCVFQDADNKDQLSYHYMGLYGTDLVAYTRLLPAQASFEEMSIGRVATCPKMRKKGLGRELMQRSIDECYRLFGVSPIKIGAQLYLKEFYESFGFRQTSNIYLEDDIQHIEMILLTV
jgi:ElaA protein